VRTMKEKFAAALERLGEHKVESRSSRYEVYSRARGGFYFLGRSGALRVGRNAATSRPVNERFKASLIASLEPVRLSDALKSWFDSFSQSAAVDMCEGGDDKECVAETCVTCIDIQAPHLKPELNALFDKHGHKAVMAEVVKTVRTL
jgi:hypothetical protein